MQSIVKPCSKSLRNYNFFFHIFIFISEQFHPSVGVWSWGQTENPIKEPNNSSRLIFCHIPCIIQLIYNINYNSQSRKLMNAINIKPFEILNIWQQHLNEKNLSGVLKLYDISCILIPTFSSEILTDHEQIKEYFVKVIEV